MGRRLRPPAAIGGAARLCTLRRRGVAQQRQWRRAVADIARRGARGPRVRLRVLRAKPTRPRCATGRRRCGVCAAHCGANSVRRARCSRHSAGAAGACACGQLAACPEKACRPGSFARRGASDLGARTAVARQAFVSAAPRLLSFTAAGKRREIGRSCRSRHAADRRAFAPSRVSRRAHDGCNPPSCRRCAAAASRPSAPPQGPLPPAANPGGVARSRDTPPRRFLDCAWRPRMKTARARAAARSWRARAPWLPNNEGPFAARACGELTRPRAAARSWLRGGSV